MLERIIRLSIRQRWAILSLVLLLSALGVYNFSRLKIDAVPGIDTSYKVTPTRLGRYPVVCAELCGLGHSVMRQTAVVVSPEEFDKWLADKAKGGSAGGAQQSASGEVDGDLVLLPSGADQVHVSQATVVLDAGTASGLFGGEDVAGKVVKGILA